MHIYRRFYFQWSLLLTLALASPALADDALVDESPDQQQIAAEQVTDEQVTDQEVADQLRKVAAFERAFEIALAERTQRTISAVMDRELDRQTERLIASPPASQPDHVGANPASR